MVDVGTGWAECLPLLTREGSLVVEAINRAQSLFPWLLRGVDFDNDSAFMNDVVVPWCREQKLEVTPSREEERSGVCRAEEWCRRPPPHGLWPLRWRRDGAYDGRRHGSTSTSSSLRSS
ncbi:hypothetical protein [Bradyrhizobium yuanmingense]|nr:hypothetical protein [Bradyrhizobium yuanmingense]